MELRDRLRADHQWVLAELVALRMARDEASSLERLRDLRRTWMIHELAEDSVVHRALHHAEGKEISHGADERFGEHEHVGALFEALGRSRPGSLVWHARLDVVREQLVRHIAREEHDLFIRLLRRFDAGALHELGERFASAQRKLTLLEQAKAA